MSYSIEIHNVYWKRCCRKFCLSPCEKLPSIIDEEDETAASEIADPVFPFLTPSLQRQCVDTNGRDDFDCDDDKKSAFPKEIEHATGVVSIAFVPQYDEYEL